MALVLNVLNPFQYNGERFDNNTALQYLRARFYNPEIKRFVNQDSYSLLNRFAYVDANPVMITDPTGHNAFNPFSAAWWSDNWNNGLLGKLTVIGVAAAGAAAAGALVAGGAYFGRRKSSSRASLLRADANESISAEAPSSGGISANIVEQSDFVSVLARNNSKFTKVEDFKEVNEVNFAQSLYLTPDGKGPPHGM